MNGRYICVLVILTPILVAAPSRFRNYVPDSRYSSIHFPHDGAVLNTAMPTIKGTLFDELARPLENQQVRIDIDAHTLATVTTNVQGVFSYSMSSAQALDEGGHVVEATVLENSFVMGPHTFFVDTLAPELPLVSYPQDGQMIDHGSVTIQGVAQEGVSVYVRIDGAEQGDLVIADQSGSWNYECELEAGTHSIVVQAESLSGTLGQESLPITIICR